MTKLTLRKWLKADAADKIMNTWVGLGVLLFSGECGSRR